MKLIRSLGCALLPLLLTLPAEAGPPQRSKSKQGATRLKGAKTYLLAYGKARVIDPVGMQRIGQSAIRLVAESARKTSKGISIDALSEAVMTREQFLSGEVKAKLSGALFKRRLKALAKKVGSRDTVLIYTHTHGRRAGFERSQPLGGLVLDLPKLKPEHRGTTL